MRRAFAVAMIVVVAACSHQSAKAAFVSSAGKACDDSAHDIEVASNAQLTASSTLPQVSYFLSHTLVPTYRTRLDKLRAITPPDADRATITSILDDETKVVDAIAADPDAFADQHDDPFAAVKGRWDQYGIPACGTRP